MRILEPYDDSVLIYKSKIPPTMRIYNNLCTAQEQAPCPIWCMCMGMSVFLHANVQEALQTKQSKPAGLFKHHQ